MNTVATASTAVASTNPPSFRTYGDSDRPAVELHHEDIDLPDYQRVKCVGQGSFGVAVLFRKVVDNSLVVLKLINMNDLTQSEKEQSLNEVNVFSNLHHPNIISYFGSFVRRNVLHIEMEYADGGTLAQIIATRSENNDWMPERLIVTIVEQIASAINYMHSEHILHRDLKTANVFLSQKGVVKIGDFGISKIMNTRLQTQTVLGTPFYLSPEMCEGRGYDTKSDIWAIGCILGEMCCLQKAFAATSLSELVAKIMSAQYNPIPERYSQGIRELQSVLLDVDCKARPSAADVLSTWIPKLIRPPSVEVAAARVGVVPVAEKSERTVVYRLQSLGTNVGLVVEPLPFPPDMRLTMLAHGARHFVAVAENGTAYTWGDNRYQQLGHRRHNDDKQKTPVEISEPRQIDHLGQYKIVDACAGDGFTVMLTDSGTLLSCGDNRSGCLGLGQLHSPTEVQKIEDDLKNVRIVQIAAGPQHVVACSEDSQLFVWGSCDGGSLGLGVDQLQSLVPCLLESAHLQQQESMKDTKTHQDLKVQKIVCSVKCTLILLANGRLLACGRNYHDRFAFGADVVGSMILKPIPIPVDRFVVDVSASEWTTAFLIRGGYVLTCGRNSEHQLGHGHCNIVNVGPTLVQHLRKKYVTRIKCHRSYCVATTDDMIVWVWGKRSAKPHQQFNDNFQVEILSTKPTEMLALYASQEQREKGHNLQLMDIYAAEHSILIHVNTTTPLN